MSNKPKKTTPVKIQQPPRGPKRKKPTIMQIDGALQQMAMALHRLEIQMVAMYRAHAHGKNPPMCKCGHMTGLHLDEADKIGVGMCIGYNFNKITAAFEPCNCEKCDENLIHSLGMS